MALWRNALNKISAKVTTYQVLASDFGTTFTNRGSTASFTFTLPTVADLPAGWWCEFYGVSAYGFVVASAGSSDNIVALNDAGADSLTMTTTSLIIGAYVRVIWDGTGWLTVRGTGNTYAVA
jgi:hypothetical protein